MKEIDQSHYRKLLALNLVFFILVGFIMWNINKQNRDDLVSLPVPPEIEAITSTSTPTRLVIPSINVDANVQLVGKTKSGNMAVPDNFTDVGWYRLGYYPGTIGNAVIAGHLDDGPKVPAVFWHLGDLKIGDEVEVDTEAGTALHFKVMGESLYDYDNAPLGEIFGTSTSAHLNLITCDGIWDPAARNYDKRLIIFTELVSETAIASSTDM